MPTLPQKRISGASSRLLDQRICDFQLDLWDTPMAKPVDRLFDELKQKGLEHFHPVIYLGDEWFSPGGVPAIAIPFYLADPKLTALEKRFIGEAEGDKPSLFMRLLRHECGHSFDHAYGVSGTSEWKALFGDKRRKYTPDHYHAEPHSRDFVHHLADFYAQSHPEEDFAETFAVWLDPRSQWRQKYRYWAGALQKLEYIEKISQHYGPKMPRKNAGGPDPLAFQAARMRRTLRSYFAEKLAAQAHEFRGTPHPG